MNTIFLGIVIFLCVLAVFDLVVGVSNGTIVMWVSRMVFTFTYRVNGKTTAYNGEMGGLTRSTWCLQDFS